MHDDYTELKIERIGHVAVLRLANPPVNALSTTLMNELTLALDRISESDDVRAVVLTGEGKVFCAGADLKSRGETIKGPGDLPQHSRRTRECFHAIRECSKPVVGAINGAALGAGLAIVASCDILVAARTAVVGLPEINVGLLGGGRHGMRLFSHSRLRRMMLTGLRVDGDELYRLGVVEASVPVEEVLDRALELAREIASKSPLSTVLAKQTLNAIEDMSLRDGYRYEQDMTAAIAKTDDAKEARLAFLEKRAPVFRGS
ncbi:enoyl-CoA hydratase/isomerase family protein [Parapusillimonas granuli]|uniref:Enoyl-CoA hydratase/isomerase family protein n=1 Tax=Parapusillimonas granuli TaxID=380911 RepID=A0A853FVY1_9BURK|nr:enoyl-CoA hydratase/isomerase family protein [Parapusillimonas granuli]MBB5213478.1 enoyl-CoA hydratase/carnithine racemase [Parapusillimonas granuli]MEB2398571.1 enoyl-CoA hydratase/isomerase family protein [Alcaligenaceae bacterium]NYT48317.1 enoyl-CoA hydratase/isomerase family protein [Parapusillimonas granuli]